METLTLTAEPQQTVTALHNTTFITANTVQASLAEIKAGHIIPTFVKDGETVISQVEFIESTADIVRRMFGGETMSEPSVRLSHPVRGRVPDARDKPASKLKESEKTIFYERAAFAIAIPSVQEDIGGNRLTLSVGGVKAYNLDNLYNYKGAEQHFKIYIGFQNTICTNLCISTDGYLADLKVRNTKELELAIEALISSYMPTQHWKAMQRLEQQELTDQQFALLLGRCRMYPYLSKVQKANIGTPGLQLTDTQLGAVVKDFFTDDNFGSPSDSRISLWKFYNLLTGANKSTYIDSFLDRSVNAYHFACYLEDCLRHGQMSWFLT